MRPIPALPEPLRGSLPSTDLRRLLHSGNPVLVLVAMLLAVLAPRPAAAHGDEGTMEVTVAEPAGATSVNLEVGILYANDDDLAAEATVTAMAAGPDGATAGPFALPQISGGRYGTTVELPAAGEWTLTITSENPAAETTATVTVSGIDPASSTTTTARASTTTTGSAAPPSTSPGSATTTEAEDELPVVPVAVGAGVAVAAVAAYLIGRRRGEHGG